MFHYHKNTLGKKKKQKEKLFLSFNVLADTAVGKDNQGILRIFI